MRFYRGKRNVAGMLRRVLGLTDTDLPDPFDGNLQEQRIRLARIEARERALTTRVRLIERHL